MDKKYVIARENNPDFGPVTDSGFADPVDLATVFLDVVGRAIRRANEELEMLRARQQETENMIDTWEHLLGAFQNSADSWHKEMLDNGQE